jgi:hypothetical protein
MFFFIMHNVFVYGSVALARTKLAKENEPVGKSAGFS